MNKLSDQEIEYLEKYITGQNEGGMEGILLFTQISAYAEDEYYRRHKEFPHIIDRQLIHWFYKIYKEEMID